jgi:hypothetical protein
VRFTPLLPQLPSEDDFCLHSMSPRPRLRVSIPETVVQTLCEALDDNIQPTFNDDDIRRRLDDVWFIVHNAISEDQTLRARLTDRDQFRKRVEEIGEQSFIDSLKDMARRKSWLDLLENSMSFLASDLHHLNPGLSPEVFLNQPKRGLSLSQLTMDGTQ